MFLKCSGGRWSGSGQWEKVELETRAEQEPTKAEPTEPKTARVEQKSTREEQLGPKIPTVEQMSTKVELRTTSVELMVQGTTKIAQAENVHQSGAEEAGDHQGGSVRTAIESTETMASAAIKGQADSSETLEVCMAQIHNMVTSITGRAAEGGRTSDLQA